MLPEHWNWYWQLEFYFYVLAIPGFCGYLLREIEYLFECMFPEIYWKPGFRFTAKEIAYQRDYNRRVKEKWEEDPRWLLEQWEKGEISHFGVMLWYHKWEHLERRKYGDVHRRAWHLEQILLNDPKYSKFLKKHERTKRRAQYLYAKWFHNCIIIYPESSPENVRATYWNRQVQEGFLGLLLRYVYFNIAFVYWGCYIDLPEGWFWTVAVIRFCLIYFYKVLLFGDIHITPEDLDIIHLYL